MSMMMMGMDGIIIGIFGVGRCADSEVGCTAFVHSVVQALTAIPQDHLANSRHQGPRTL